MTKDSQWHLSKSIPISFLVVIVLQTFSAVWWAATINQKVNENSNEDVKQWVRIEKNEEILQDIKSNSRATTAILERVEDDVGELTGLVREYLKNKK